MQTFTRKCVLSTCTLNQWAMDFDSNLERTMESIRIAKSKGSKYRLGPELEISGYSCEDHFLELDTFFHCEQSLVTILESDLTLDIICDIGCPMMYGNVRYNCRVICLNKKIVLIRPKVNLADDGNYREKRFFTAWKSDDFSLHDYNLPESLAAITKQTTVPFGLGVLRTQDTTIGFEMCEELWTPNSPHIQQFLSGVEIVCNGSGSHHSLRKLDSRLNLMKSATSKCGGVYMYSNIRGCDGNRLYFDGCSLICVNGELVTQASQFSLNDVEVMTSVVDLDDVRSHRNATNSLQEQSSKTMSWPQIDLTYFTLRTSEFYPAVFTSKPIATRIHSPEEECALGPACWLWDYLRRSGASGYLLPISGGADSSSTAAIVRVMCVMAARAALTGNEEVIKDIINLCKKKIDKNFASDLQKKYHLYDSTVKQSEDMIKFDGDLRVNDLQVTALANDLMNQIFHTVYLGTANSSPNTADRAKRLSDDISAYHLNINFETVVQCVINVFVTFSGIKQTPRYVSQGGTIVEDLALQNIQARLRMVLSYLCAQLFPWVRGSTGFLLVLGSANVDEALRGYMTKYDCSSADINPIGGLSKGDLKRMLLYIAKEYDLPVLSEVANATPTAELRPITEGDGQESNQRDEDEMGMTYDELGIFGKLRKIGRCGPVAMFLKLLDLWHGQFSPAVIADKVKKFFYYYAINRHKLVTLTPSYHAESYSPDDNRFDLRQFLYNAKWTRQFHSINSILSYLSINNTSSDPYNTVQELSTHKSLQTEKKSY